jgi:hypothetical protein
LKFPLTFFLLLRLLRLLLFLMKLLLTFVLVRFGALEEVFMSYRPHGAWRTMEVLEELA